MTYLKCQKNALKSVFKCTANRSLKTQQIIVSSTRKSRILSVAQSTCFIAGCSFKKVRVPYRKVYSTVYKKIIYLFKIVILTTDGVYKKGDVGGQKPPSHWFFFYVNIFSNILPITMEQSGIIISYGDIEICPIVINYNINYSPGSLYLLFMLSMARSDPQSCLRR